MTIKAGKATTAKSDAIPVAKVVGKHKKIKAADIKAIERKAKKKKPPTDKEREKLHAFAKTHKLVRCGKISVYYRKKGQRKGALSSWKLGFDLRGKFYKIDMVKHRAAKAGAKSSAKGGIKT